MKKLIIFFLVASMVAFMPLVASAVDQVEGSVQGFTCVTQGKTCPVGMEDPMAAAEGVFVVLTKDNTYYFVTNVDRAVMARHINDKVRVSGGLNTKFNAITADKIEVYSKGTWKTTWTYTDELETIEKLIIPFEIKTRNP